MLQSTLELASHLCHVGSNGPYKSLPRSRLLLFDQFRLSLAQNLDETFDPPPHPRVHERLGALHNSRTVRSTGQIGAARGAYAWQPN